MKRTSGVVATWRAVMFEPRVFFSSKREPPSETGPLRFAALVSLFATPVASLVLALFDHDASAGQIALRIFAAALFGPFLTCASVYVVAALTHALLKILGSAPKPFAVTLGVVGYAAAPIALSVVPFVGAIVSAVWQLVLIGIGLRRRQGGATAIAVLAALAVPGITAAVAIVLRIGVVEAFKLPSGSMIPTLVVGDHVFVSKLAYAELLGRKGPAPADVVVFRFPENREQDFVKRVVAIGGDKIEAIGGRVIVNDKVAPECYVGAYPYEGGTSHLYVEFLGGRSYLTQYARKHDEGRCDSPRSCDAGEACRAGVCGVLQGPWSVPAGQVFVMGDNRDNSHDSRQWFGGRGGGVERSDVKGRVSMVWMSFKAGGGIANERLGLDVSGAPHPPASASPAVAQAIADCIAKGPPAS